MINIGTDIIEIDRIRALIARFPDHFYHRVLTEKEQKYCLTHRDPAVRCAGRFCAKEAIVKALGTGIGKEVGWNDIEILNNEKGAPVVFLSDRVMKSFQNPRITLSISHSKTVAMAVATWE